MKITELFTLCALVLMIILFPLSSRSEEGGSGHYAPGANASFIDTLPSKQGLVLGNFFNYYDGSASMSRVVPNAGLLIAGMDATAYCNTVLGLYQTPFKMLGGSYTVGAAIPYIWLNVKGHAQGPDGQGGTVRMRARDSDNGVGDILLYPFMLAWQKGDLKYDIRVGVYAPTGDYEKGKLANLGKNYWTFEPAVSLSYMSSKTGFELTAFAGIDFNTKNPDTEYKSGTQLHLDMTAAQHLPLVGGIVGIGANGFYYQQVSGDSGSGALAGDFKGMTIGVGPVVSYIRKICGIDLAAEVKWLPEIDVKKRLKGDYVWFKLGLQF